MSLFNNIFKRSTENDNADQPSKRDGDVRWITLTSIHQLEDIIEQSKTKTQIIFKHSTRCGISRMVINQFKKAYKFDEFPVNIYYLDLISYRDVSNAIANQLNVHHESPQLLIIKNGIVVKHDSHSAINELQLENWV